MITIYNPDNTVLLNVEVEDRSYRIREIMGEHALYLYFSLAEYIEIIPGTYVDFNGERYLLRKPDNFKKNHTRDINYTLKLEPYSAILRDVKFKYFAGSAIDFELDFPLNFQPINFLQLIVDNLNANDSGWTTGQCDIASEMTLTFSNENCDQAIRKIAEAFNTEFEVVGKVLHLHKVERADTALPLAYGKDQGFKPGLGRVNVDDSKVINRLYVISSDRNIDNLTYGANTLRLPTSTQIALNGITYVTDAYGLYLERLNLTGRRVEETADLSYIYPKREGTVSQVVEVDAENNFYDIYDNSIPEALDFTAYLIEGTTMTIVFQDGNLAGMEFEVEYIHASRQFKLVPKEVNGLNYPQAPDIPSIGDKYAVFNVMLPQTYIDDASQELLDETLRLLADAEKPRYSFTGTLDEIYASKNWATISDRINLGNLVSFSDSQFLTTPILIRITSVKEYVNRPKAPVLELANNITGKSFNDTISSLRAEIIAGAYSSVLRNNLDLKDIFLYKNAPDTANEHITFAKGLTAQEPIVAENGLTANEASIDQATILSTLQSEVFINGFLGSGFRLFNNLGNWDLEVDSLVVRKNMDVFQLTIQQIQAVGGQILLTPASMTCTSVEVLTNAYRCYFNTDGQIANLFQVNDQAICQQFDGANQKRYWRLVTATGVDYIELSKTDVDGAGIPAKGDEIVQLGHRTDTARQNAILISSYGDPKLEQYKGINGYTLTGKLVTRISPEGNIFRAAEFIVETAGGEENLHTLIQANESEIVLRATQSSVDSLTGRVGDAEAELIIQADEISSKVSMTEVNEAVDSIEVGGRNLFVLNGPAFWWSLGGTGQMTQDYSDGYKNTKATRFQSTGGYHFRLNFLVIKAPSNVTISFWYKCLQPSYNFLPDINDREFNIAIDGSQSTEWKKYSDTRFIDNYIGTYGFIDIELLGDSDILISDIQVELGIIATDWTPAPEDVKSDAEDDATDKSNAAQAAAEAYAEAQALLAEITSMAYADGIVTDEELRAIADATAKANAAQAAAILAAAADAESKINDLEIGGRNLFVLDGSIYEWTLGGSGQITRDYTDGYKNTKALRLQSTGEYHFRFSFLVIKDPSNVTISFWYKCLQPSYSFLPDINDREFNIAIDGSQSTEWKKYSDTRFIDNYIGTYGFIDVSLLGDSDILISDIQIEIGSKATDWTPAPEDVQKNIDTAEYNAKTYADTEFVAKTVHQSDITQLSDSISQRVLETEFDANNIILNQRVSSVEQTADSFSVKLYDSVDQNRGRLNNVRYLRDWTNGSTASVYNSWIEVKAIDIDGQNVALGKTPVYHRADGVVVSYTNPEVVTDGIVSSSYSHAITPNSEDYVQIDLGAVHVLREIKSWHYYLDGRTSHLAKVEVSENGIDWYIVFSSEIEGEYPETIDGHTVQNPYIYEAGKALAPTGLDIINRSITLTSDNTFLKANDGTKIAAFIMKDGQPVMQAQNIDVENLVARVLQTQTIGARVEINGISNSIVIYDSDNNPKILLSPKAVMSEADIADAGTITSTYVQREVTLSNEGSSVMFTSEEVVISDNKNYTIITPQVYYVISAAASKDATEYASVRVLLKEIISGSSVLIATYNVVSISEDGIPGELDSKVGTIPITRVSGMTNGTYKMEITVTLTGTGTGIAYSKIYANQVLQAESMIAYQEIGLDGFNFINSASDYVHNSGGAFMIKKGTKSIQVTNTYVKINGVTQ